MTPREREMLIDFIIDAVYEIEGVKLDRFYFADKTQEEIQEEADWLDYLLGK
ncbi:hypothetical protein ABEX38_29965 [Priestia megaterium]